jgi:hypothetical protein
LQLLVVVQRVPMVLLLVLVMRLLDTAIVVRLPVVQHHARLVVATDHRAHAVQRRRDGQTAVLPDALPAERSHVHAGLLRVLHHACE